MSTILHVKYFNGINAEFYYTALDLALQYNNTEIGKLLIARPDININMRSILDFFMFKCYCKFDI